MTLDDLTARGDEKVRTQSFDDGICCATLIESESHPPRGYLQKKGAISKLNRQECSYLLANPLFPPTNLASG